MLMGLSATIKFQICWICFSQNSLVRLLTGKERDKARSVFLGLAQDKDGVITRAECHQAQQSWFHKLKDSQSCNVRWVHHISLLAVCLGFVWDSHLYANHSQDRQKARFGCIGIRKSVFLLLIPFFVPHSVHFYCFADDTQV